MHNYHDDTLPLLKRDGAVIAAFLGDAASELVFERPRRDGQLGRVTIAIPTFNRPELLKEALESVWAQEGFNNYDLIVVDNASSVQNVANVLAFLEASDRPVRYYVNSHNVGGFPNWNRCLAYSQTTWVSILNDDDLLKPSFLLEAMQYVDRDPNIDAIVCQVDLLDQRSKGMRKSRIYTAMRPTFISAVRFLGRRSIRITPKRLFWSNIAGNSLGSLYRRDLALRLGGFDQKEAPNGDYVLNVRLSIEGKFLQLRAPLALLRLQVNDSASPSTLSGVAVRNYMLRNRMADEGIVPMKWKKWASKLFSHELEILKSHWKSDIDIVEISREVGLEMHRNRTSFMYAVRILRGGF